MTGYGASEVIIRNSTFRIDIKSLNSKGLEINFKLPGFLSEHDWALRKELSTALVRGKADIKIYEDKRDASQISVLNFKLLQTYFDQLNDFSNKNNLSTAQILPSLLSMPHIYNVEEVLSDENEIARISLGIKEAIEQLNVFRLQEGEMLESELRTRIASVFEGLAQLQPLEEGRIIRIRSKLISELEQLQKSLNVDRDRLEQEMIYHIEKLDITEEKVRLKAHCEYFLQILNDSSTIEKGKKLGFITQEMGRETNTIGSKANDAEIQRIVVLMKEEIEKIKEQVNNVL